MRLLATDRELCRHSYYDATSVRPAAAPPLRGSASCDVAIVGGGLAGLSAALELARRGRAVTLLEARTVGSGASGRNGGQAIHGLACDLSVVESELGHADARRVWDMTIEALDLMRRRIVDHAIDCEWRDGQLSVATSARKGKALLAWADRLERDCGYPLRRIGARELHEWIASARYHAGVLDLRSGHLHPLKYTLGLYRAALEAGVRVHEHSEVHALEHGPVPSLRTDGGRVQARQVLLAGNAYLEGVAPELEPRIMPVGTYIACTERLDRDLVERLIPSRAAVCDTNVVLDYFRTTADDRMLYGGRVSYSTATPRHLAQRLQRRMQRTFPQLAHARMEFAWGGFVDISMNRAPDFGRLSARGAYAPNVYYLQGFSGHGLALAGLAGRLVAEAVAGDASRFDVFARIRHRPFPGGRALRMPALVLGMAWYRLRDLLG